MRMSFPFSRRGKLNLSALRLSVRKEPARANRGGLFGRKAGDLIRDGLADGRKVLVDPLDNEVTHSRRNVSAAFKPAKFAACAFVIGRPHRFGQRVADSPNQFDQIADVTMQGVEVVQSRFHASQEYTQGRGERVEPGSLPQKTSIMQVRTSPEEVYRRAMAALPSGLPRFISDDVVSSLCLAILEGEINVNEMPAQAKVFLRAYNREYHTFQTVSLDVLIPGTKTTYLDALVAES